MIRDTDTVLQIIIEKMGTCNIVRSLLENIETSLEKSLEKLLAFLIEIVRERTDIKFYGKEISVHLRTLFVHPNPEIRKNVVLILAELKEMMGKDFDNLWELFSIQQKKLIEIYHHKITEE